MKSINKTFFGLLGPLACAALLTLSGRAVAQDIGMICESSGTSPNFALETADGYISTPDGNIVYMWGYALDDGNPSTDDGFQMPGPVLCVNEGDTVNIVLTNNTLDDPVSIVFPGQEDVSASPVSGPTSAGHLTLEAEQGGVVSYSFVASEPGTYLYESGTMRHKQVHMGLYGVLVVRPTLGDHYAYNDESTEFSDEFLIVLHEIDPVLHRLVDPNIRPNENGSNQFDQTTRHDRYWTINGRSNPDLLQDNFVPWFPTQPYSALVRAEACDPNPGTVTPGEPEPADCDPPILVRYANAGTVNHPFHPHGDDLEVIGQDGRFLGDARMLTFTKTIAGGQTNDLLFSWANVESWLTSVSDANGPVPVDIPTLQNLVFKDDVTFYSGDAHLGFVGTLPQAVTTFNECGEFYFPWHSHALQTVQNFDEGFGGMLTLVRVDPPGGCQ